MTLGWKQLKLKTCAVTEGSTVLWLFLDSKEVLSLYVKLWLLLH